MVESEPSFLALFTDQERLHFRNLVLLRPQLPSERQFALIQTLAQNLRQPRLLTLIARTPHWLLHAPILHALAANEATPEPIRRDLELAVSLFDLMHTMDRAPANEREERADTVKQVYAQLPMDLRAVVKQQLKQLARQVQPTGQTQELPPLPTEQQDWETLTEPPRSQAPAPEVVQVSREEQLTQASSTHVQEELREALAQEDAEIRLAALHNPTLSEELLLEAIRASSHADLFEDVYGEARWYFREPIREALYAAPALPSPFARKLRIGRNLVEALARQHDARQHHAQELRRLVSLFLQLDETEYQFVTWWAKRQAPHLLRVIKVFYDRLQRRRATQANGLTSQSEGRWASLEERVFLANQSTQPEQIMTALRDPDATVFSVVLENPGLTTRELLSAIPAMDGGRAEKLAAHRVWGDHPTVREALLHNPHLSQATALRLLPSLTTPRMLLDLLRDLRVTHLDVKQKALETLRELYLAMPTLQRIVTLRSSGGELIRHLPQDVFNDEETLSLMIADRQLDPGILLRLARNKQTPRPILEAIAGHPTLMAHPPIMSELLLNPKTPRESAIRVWGLLSDSEQQQLL
ncbi:MAG: hypothetical protein LWX11_04130, partial [Firmicutes bacterium]|nr:hypothetical protein [Bacillota bacterium]